MDKIFKNKNVIAHVLDYLEISDFLNLELTNLNIKSCVDFYYEMKNCYFQLNSKDKSEKSDKMVRKNSKMKKQQITKYKKNYISKYLNSLVVFPINEQFDEDEISIENHSKIHKDEEINAKTESSKKIINSAKFFKNCIDSENRELKYFFDSSCLVKQIFYSNDKLFFFYTSDDLNIFSQIGSNYFKCLFTLYLNKKNINKILYYETNHSFFALTEEGNIYQFYYPTENSIKISERLEHDKKEGLVKKLKNIDNTNEVDKYLCNLIQLNSNSILFTDIFLMKNYLILIDNNFNVYYLNIDNLQIEFFETQDESGNNGDIKTEVNLDDKIQNSPPTLINKSNNHTDKKENLILIDDKNNNENISNLTLKENNDLINLEVNILKNTKYENSYILKPKIKFEEIIVKLDKNHNKIIKIDCSESNLLFADDEQKLFYIPYSELSKDALKSPKLVPDTKLTNIVEISCGDGFFMILEREDIPSFEKWTETDIYEWFKEMKLDEYLNIVKYEKIKGIDLINADDAYFINNLGMEDDVISKMKYEINQLKNNSKCKSMNLWGWGTNKNGQLGQMDYSNTYLRSLTKINIPELKENLDFIVTIKCLKNYSVFLTKFGEIYITGNYSMKKKLEENLSENQNSNNFNNQNFNNNTTNNQNRDRKNKKDRKDSNANNNQIQKPKNKWVNITKRICFDVLKENNNHYEDIRQSLFFKARNLLATNSCLFSFGYKSHTVPFTLQNKLPKLKHLKKGEKFPTSDSVIEKILKKENKNKEKFIIVYDDAKLKFLETSLLNYIESEVPYHKILQIKYYNEIIWDRKKRYYKYDY